MLKIVNYFYMLTNPEAKQAALAVFSEFDNSLTMICPCRQTVDKLLGESHDYYLARIWEDGTGN
jgi:hypothetical protein